MNHPLHPKRQGLYDPQFEHDACGIGAVANISGERTHDIMEKGHQILVNLMHRGAAGADESTGDGAGILFQLPHEFLADEASKLNISLPAEESYAVAMVFNTKDAKLRSKCEDILVKAIGHYGMKVLGWRDVPGEPDCLGEIARAAEPHVRQLFIDGNGLSDVALERKLYMARKRAEKQVLERFGEEASDFYIPSMSCRTICYKGMFLAPQLFQYYPDLHDKRVVTALALVHQRYSTNTFPNWQLAQPFRMCAHNGEINTLSGNRNRMRARERQMVCPELADDLSDLFPILTEGASDSACFDNAMELLIRAGRTLPHSLMMLIPEAFGPTYHISTDKRAFYEYHASVMEPWDGPAAMVVTDGRVVGGTLDRNGLRPARYVVTTDGMVVLGSEIGVMEFPPEKIKQKGRLRPGRMFLVDTKQGRIIVDNEIKGKIARMKPYRRWLDQGRIELPGMFSTSRPPKVNPETLAQRQRMFGYTREDMEMLLVPMAAKGQEPVGSMGADTPLAVLSGRPKLLFNYFKQLFAQVTNPPIDPLREGLVMSLMSFTGKQRNLLEESADHCKQLKLRHPVLTNDDMERLRATRREDLKVATIPALFDVDYDDPEGALTRGIDAMLNAAEAAIKNGASILIVSDRDASTEKAPIPSLLATGALHHGLLDRGLRGEAGLVIETGEAREVMHFCLLCGYGANAVNPYLAFESLHELYHRKYFDEGEELEQLLDKYITAIRKGLLKTMSKMGISTLRSYHAAQLFEAIGLNKAMVDKYFKGTTSRIEGATVETIAMEALARHREAYTDRLPGMMELDFGGEYHVRLDGENHLWNQDTISLMQHAVRNNDPEAYHKYAALINDQAEKIYTLRGMFRFKPGQSIPIDEVEPASEIVKRFCTGAMSHGSISKEAHETLAIGMNRLKAMSNTGEGGEDPQRYIPMANGDSMNSAIKQVASGRFGVTSLYLSQARMIQIKMAQGAKPGEGGQLPSHKVTDEIAKLRFSTPGVSLISPPPHHDIYSIEDLAQLIYDLKCSNPGVMVSVKLVSEVGVGTVAAGVAKGNSDEVLISGHDGGTGASPLSSIKHAGIPWELGLAETQQTLVLNGLRDRILVQADGQMKTGRDIAIAALLGAERFGFGTASLVALGCILMRKCHLGTCPVGIATQEHGLRKKFIGKAEHLERFMLFVAEEMREIMASLGFRKVDDMVGRVDCLDVAGSVEHWKARGLDFSAIFAKPDVSKDTAIRCIRSQSDTLKTHLDWEILKQAEPAIEQGKPVKIDLPVRNVHRTVGAILSNRIVKKYGAEGLPEDTIDIHLTGSAGQSFGAFCVPGVTLRLTGDTNDYLGKGLSGGKIIVMTPPTSRFVPDENIIVGNTLLYGAIKGEVFIHGVAGERFAVRNSGAVAVVEGVGDHGCEYMTGGRVVVIGKTGRNFAAGMSGGIAYVLDEHQLFDTLCNLDMVDLEFLWQEKDIEFVRERLEKHYHYTSSERAKRILDNWDEMAGKFVKVMPIDYRRALERMRDYEQTQSDYTPATEEVIRG
jgi:glutamate synthase domain-containing protein 2/glutamate synthase domain-containing protein 1/glutamate synthase domain-containing protein 3